MPRRHHLFIVLFASLAILLFILDLLMGSAGIPVKGVIAALFGNEGAEVSHVRIVQGVRLPQALTAACAGAALAVCGALMQTLFRNALAGPSVLGVTSGAGLGVALLMLGGGTLTGAVLQIGLLGASFLGALAVLGLVLLADRRVGDGTTLLVVGLMIGYLCGALISVLEVYGSAGAVKSFVLWGMGSFAGTDAYELWFLVPTVLFGCGAALLMTKSMNALLAGEEQAAALGLDVTTTRRAAILFSGLLASAITAFCGPVAFIGLVTPHLVRGMLRSTDHRAVLRACIFLGSALALFCDMVTRLPGVHGSLPLNAVTSMLGAPVVVWVLWQGRNFYRSA